MTALIEARGLDVAVPGWGLADALLRRPRGLILSGVDLAVETGTTMAVVGESGSGKSTLARTLLGLMQPCGGSVRFKGREVGGPGVLAELRRSVRFLFQNPMGSLNPRMKVADLVAEPIRIHEPGHADPREEALAMLDAVGLPARFADRRPHELSGGQAGRVCIARALAVRPELIVADEPTAGFDVSVQAEILNLLAQLQAEFGLTYLIISHDLGIVRHFSDELAVLYMGRVVERGPTAKVFARPDHPYTESLLAAFDPSRRPAAPPSFEASSGERL
jgi:ABC-type glutathione transport system ATPase component